MGDGPEVTLIVNIFPDFSYTWSISSPNMRAEQGVIWFHSCDLSSNIKNKVIINLFSYMYLSVWYFTFLWA